MPRRRSARIRNSDTPDRSAVQKTPRSNAQLGSVIERDETPENGPHRNLDSILSPSNEQQQTDIRSHLAELSTLNTPKTAPKPAQSEMHPQLVHKSTTKAPDSGQRLGFSDISRDEVHNTPSKTTQAAKAPEHMSSPDFKFKFVSGKSLSQDAQKLRAEIRDKASQIKDEMRAQQHEQSEAEGGPLSATDRKIAKPKSKTGRFSDVHMAEFKKMDSIENHPSAFRNLPTFGQPTTSSLKRSSSKAGLDELARPRTASKVSSVAKSSFSKPPTLTHKSSLSRFGSSSASSSSQPTSPVKRTRQFDDVDVSAARPLSRDSASASVRSSNLPRPKSSSTLFSPTKASLGHSASARSLSKSSSKSSLLPRSRTGLFCKLIDKEYQAKQDQPHDAPVPKMSLLPKSPNMKQLKEATTMSRDIASNLTSEAQSPIKRVSPLAVATPLKTDKGMKSKLPMFSGLKSILRRTGSRPVSNDPVKIAAGTHVASSAGNPTVSHRLDDLSSDGVQNAPKRRSTLFDRADTPKKRVEFTPSVKDRFDLVADSPSPVKSAIPKDAPAISKAASGRFDPAAFAIDPDATESDGWESADEGSDNGEIDYPALSQRTSTPKTSLTDSSRRQTGFQQHLQQQSQPKSRNDPGFKSIFTTLRKPSSKASPASIRRVRDTEAFPIAAPGSSSEDVAAATSTSQTNTNPPYPSLPTIPHGIPSKKRRRSSSLSEGEKLGFRDFSSPAKPRPADEDKENRHRRTTFNVSVPGDFPRDSDIGSSGTGVLESTASSRAKSEQPEEEKRSAKRTKIGQAEVQVEVVIPVDKKKKKKPVSNTRKEAAASAKLRKAPRGGRKSETSGERGTPGQGKGVLSLSRLNMLARPKDRK